MTLDTLLRRRDIWRGGQISPPTLDRLSTGFAALDAALPGGGWPQGALTEILPARASIGELQLVTPALAQLSRRERWIAWIAPPHYPYPPALTRAGIESSRVLLVHPRAENDTLWAMEQALRSGTCSAVLAWPRRANNRALRRLQLAAETGQAWGFLFRSLRDAGSSSLAALRLCLEPLPDGLAVHIIKCRGGVTSSLTLTLTLLLAPSHKGRG
ncbi:MAG: translesion DNA synthesis-associated protein ImuA [Acidiferrobacterales bacterium]